MCVLYVMLCIPKCGHNCNELLLYDVLFVHITVFSHVLSTTRPLPLRSHDTSAVIVTPTRELAIQIDHVIRSLMGQLPSCELVVQTFIGGYSTDEDTNKFKQEGCVTMTSLCIVYTYVGRCNVLIATPGRLVDLLQREDFGLSHSVKSLVSNLLQHHMTCQCHTIGAAGTR